MGENQTKRENLESSQRCTRQQGVQGRTIWIVSLKTKEARIQIMTALESLKEKKVSIQNSVTSINIHLNWRFSNEHKLRIFTAADLQNNKYPEGYSSGKGKW